MSSVAITGASSLASASQSLLALTAAPFVFLTLPAAILGKEILNEISFLIKESDASRAMQESHAGCCNEGALLLHSELEREWQKERDRIAALSSSSARKSLEEHYERSYRQYKADASRGQWSQLDSLVRNLRTLITETEIEEHSCAQLERELGQLCEELSTTHPEKTSTVIEGVRESLQKTPTDRFTFLANSIAAIKPLADTHKQGISLDQPCVAEILSFAEKIKILDVDAFERLAHFIEEIELGTPFRGRAEMILTEFKIQYASLKEEMAIAQTLRDELAPLLPLLEKTEDGKALAMQISEAMRTKFISRKEFLDLYERARVHIWESIEREREQELTSRATTLLEGLGYQLEDERALEKKHRSHTDEIHYFNSPYKGYHVMVKISEGDRIATRLVRFVENGSEMDSPYQKQRDIEIGKNWCKDLNYFLQELENQGFSIQKILRQEPEEANILVICDPNRAHSKNTHAKINTPRQRSLRTND